MSDPRPIRIIYLETVKNRATAARLALGSLGLEASNDGGQAAISAVSRCGSAGILGRSGGRVPRGLDNCEEAI